jgi:hypothetical protein
VPSPRRPSGGRLIVVVVGLVVMAVLAVFAVVSSDDDDGTSGGAATSTTAADGPASDEVVAGSLLPPIGALGPEWVESARDDEPSEATGQPDDPCAVGPIPEGFLIRSEQRRLVDGATVETLSVTAGVVAEDVEPASLADPVVVDCLRLGLEGALPDGSSVAVLDGAAPAAPDGATVGAVRFGVTTAGGEPAGRFEFVQVQRGRAVSLGLLTGVQGVAPSATLDDVATALDGPLAAGAERLG